MLGIWSNSWIHLGNLMFYQIKKVMVLCCSIMVRGVNMVYLGYYMRNVGRGAQTRSVYAPPRSQVIKIYTCRSVHTYSRYINVLVHYMVATRTYTFFAMQVWAPYFYYLSLNIALAIEKTHINVIFYPCILFLFRFSFFHALVSANNKHFLHSSENEKQVRKQMKDPLGI